MLAFVYLLFSFKVYTVVFSSRMIFLIFEYDKQESYNTFLNTTTIEFQDVMRNVL